MKASGGLPNSCGRGCRKEEAVKEIVATEKLAASEVTSHVSDQAEGAAQDNTATVDQTATPVTQQVQKIERQSQPSEEQAESPVQGSAQSSEPADNTPGEPEHAQVNDRRDTEEETTGVAGPRAH